MVTRVNWGLKKSTGVIVLSRKKVGNAGGIAG
jgi:hypothetical protein